MAKTRTLKVINGRIQFKCFNCQARRLIGVAQHVRRRSIKCHKCGEITKAILNRRMVQREQQYGNVLLYTMDGSEMEVSLFNISLHGVGFEVPIQLRQKLSVGQIVEFRCPWNPKLLSQVTYQIRSIVNQKVGAEKTRKSEWNI